MIKTIITGAVISQGYDNTPALKFSEKGDAVRFRIGKKVYDPKEDDNHRWINLPVKAFGSLCSRVKKMKLQAGSYINLLGRLDEEEWTDKAGEKHSTMVLILDDIEYCSGGGQKKEPSEEAPQPMTSSEPPQEEPSTFTGYKSSLSPQAYHLVVYDSGTGSLLASVYDQNTEIIEQYTVHTSARDGAALFFAMMPQLMEDKEFQEYFQIYLEQYRDSFPDFSKAAHAMAILCDNAYRRIKDTACPAHLKVNVDRSGNLMRVSRAQLDSGLYQPTEVLAGEFTIFTQNGKPVVHKPVKVIDHKDFVGKYVLNPSRKLTPAERAQVPVLPEWYIIPQEAVDICKHAQLTTGKPTQMRNFLLRGPAGTGKTMGAKAIAAGLGLPYMKYTCSAGTEIYDFVGMVFPNTEHSTGNAQLDQEREQLQAMGGVNYANVSKLLHLPELDDMDYDPAGVYQALTGVENQAATPQDCMELVLEKVTEKVRQLSVSVEGETQSQTYTYVETDFIKALKNGYLVEIQEPSTILQPGVLVGLNSLLEQSGTITLPTGEVIRRHPDAVVVVTTNVSYEGCRGMNQSVVDRMSLVKDIELPSPEVMAQRVMAVTGAEDEYQVCQMVQVTNDLADYCRKNGITDGTVGMRSLIDWVTSAEISGDPYTAALDTIISKATADEEDREALITSILDPVFAPKRRKTA